MKSVSKVSFLVLAIALSLMLLTVSANAQCGQKRACVSATASLDTDRVNYQVGEAVTLIFSNPENFDYLIERIHVKRSLSDCGGFHSAETIFTYEFPNTVIASAEWTWTWNQLNEWGEQVKESHYEAVLETRCCGTFKAKFKIGEPCQPTCEPCCRPCKTCYKPCYYPCRTYCNPCYRSCYCWSGWYRPFWSCGWGWYSRCYRSSCWNCYCP